MHVDIGTSSRENIRFEIQSNFNGSNLFGTMEFDLDMDR